MPQTDSLETAFNTCMVYITAGSHDEALTIARTLIAERLAACANILGPATSIYTWQGTTEEAQEFVLIAKTRRTLAGRLSARVKALHSYDTPCIVTYPMGEGYPPFLRWIEEATIAG